MSTLVQNWGSFWLGFFCGAVILFSVELSVWLICLRVFNGRKNKNKESASKKFADRERSQRLSTQFNMGGYIANTIQTFIADHKLNSQISVSRINNENLGYSIIVAWVGAGSAPSTYLWGGTKHYGFPIFHVTVDLSASAQIHADSEECGIFLSGASKEEADYFITKAKSWILGFADYNKLPRHTN